MVIIITGLVGLDKKNYLEKVCEYAGLRGKELTL